MDPITVAGGGLAILGSKEIIEKLLGPTADYLGAELRTYAEKGVKNLRRVFDNGVRKVGSRLEEPGQVPPRVLKSLLTEGYFCEDELGAEYFGGVLASARTGVARDDRGAAIISLIARLSTYQLRAHYIFFTALKQLYGGSSANLGHGPDRNKSFVFFPVSAFLQAMDFDPSERGDALVGHILNGLCREGLISEHFGAGTPLIMKENFDLVVSEDGIVFTPGAIGVELYYWAHGCGNRGLHEFLQTSVSFEPLAGLSVPEGVIRPRLASH